MHAQVLEWQMLCDESFVLLLVQWVTVASSVTRSLTQNQHNSCLKTAQKFPGKPPKKADNFRHLFRHFSLYVPLVICNSTICLAYHMLLLSFVLCIIHQIVSCQAAHATGLLSYAIINSLAVSTDHWFPLKTAVAQYPRQVPKPPKNRNPRPPKIARPMSLINCPIGRENRGAGNTGC